MREFYVYGFKSREEFSRKSARSYDDERRRIESWLGDYMGFRQTPEGKNVFLSIDSRVSCHNPLYKAWKAKSFTDGDITLHFILFDILYAPEIALSVQDIIERICDRYLSFFDDPMVFDESTVRKKLKEYTSEGIILTEKRGRQVLYHRAQDIDLRTFSDALDFFSETAPCGVIGSFLLDKSNTHSDHFNYKHHYITHTMDSGVLCTLFSAMREKRMLTVTNRSRRVEKASVFQCVPLRVLISVQNGRQHLLSYHTGDKQIKSYRLDCIAKVDPGDVYPGFDELREKLNRMRKHMWGVICRKNENLTEHVEFTVSIHAGEEHILQRLIREKRCGSVDQIDEHTCRFRADVYDTNEMIPWIRTFICRITQMNFSNRIVENRFREDLEAMYLLYGLDGGAIQ